MQPLSILRRSHAALALLCVLRSPGVAGGESVRLACPASLQGRVEKLEQLDLVLTFPESLSAIQPAAGLEPVPQRTAAWSGLLGDRRFWIYVFAMPREEFGYVEPEDVRDDVADGYLGLDGSGFVHASKELVEGRFGQASHGALGWGPLHAKDGRVIGTFFVLGGLSRAHGYAIEVEIRPAADAQSEKLVLDFLRKGVVCTSEPRDPRWTAEECKARWLQDAPPDLAKKLEKPVRTKHYVFLSNTDAARQMGDYMEKFYATIQATYPFPEVAGRRLMPVFLFRTPEQYHAFYASQFRSTVEEARKSKGVASGDFYATYYDAPQDPVHIHEATHQIFSNRLNLEGAGSWFQEGVAEYMSSSAADLTDASNLVKKERHTRLSELVAMESLLWNEYDEKKHEGQARSNYLQAALLIEFVREAKWSKGKFLDWLQAVGRCPPNDAAAIERAIQATLGVGLTEFEDRWVEYCKKR